MTQAEFSGTFHSKSASNSSRNSQLRVLIGALSLLTLQLQGCEAMSTDLMDIPYVFTATWIGLLGAYLLWMSQCSRRSTRAHQIAPSFGFADGSDDADTASVTSNATEDTDEYPPFSPEGMISWVFERCNRRCRKCNGSCWRHSYVLKLTTNVELYWQIS